MGRARGPCSERSGESERGEPAGPATRPPCGSLLGRQGACLPVATGTLDHSPARLPAHLLSALSLLLHRPGSGGRGAAAERRGQAPPGPGEEGAGFPGKEGPLPTPLRVTGPTPSVSLRAPASGRAGLGVIGFPSCVWEIRF